MVDGFPFPAPTPPEPIVCGGLNDERIDQFAKSTGSARGYLDSTFSYLKDQWRSRSCSFMSIRDASSWALPDGWKRRHGVPTCGQCLASLSNIRRHISKLEEIQAKESGRTSSFMPCLELMTSRLAHLFREAMNKHGDSDLALAQVEHNQDALDCIAILSRRKAMDIPVTTNI